MGAPALEVGLRPRPRLISRFSAGHLVMVLAGILGALLTLAVLRSADATVPVAVARGDLAPGTVVGRDSFRLVDVKADAGILATLIGAEQLDDFVGHVVIRPLADGELVGRSVLQAAEERSASRSMSFAVGRDRAVGGDLSAGDRVDVVVAHDGAARYVMVDAEVLAVDGGGSGPLGGRGDDLTVTLAVDDRTAIELAAALDGGTVTLVRSTGAPPVSDPDPGEGGDS